ncbi:major facilitator superfamily domain-containing protein [Xylariaceae sp. FL0662B]|nr:major facilitator superfamily domain-containing protein [Xylariaceae sp. FL0662B]
MASDTAADASGKSAGSRMGPFRRRLLMGSLCLTLLLAALDITIVATALPTIAGTLGADAAAYAWVGSAYALASTSATPVWAKLSDVFGRKPVLTAANGVFMVGSLVAALAASVVVLIAGRVLQGLGAGGIVVLVTIIIGDLFALGERAKYFGFISLVWAIAGPVGPVLGGVFTQTIGWRWCFWINLPIEGISLAVLIFVLKVDSPSVGVVQGLKSLDWAGLVIIVGGTICFLYGLESGAGGTQAWGSAMVLCLIIFGVVLLALFVAYEAKIATDPIIPMQIFSPRTNIATFTMTCLQSFVFISFDYFLPLYFQVVLKFRPIISGALLLALAIPLTITSVGSGIFVSRTGNFIVPIRLAAIVMTLGTGLLIDLDPIQNWPKIIIFQILAGLGAGPLFQAPIIALQSHLKPSQVPAAMSAFTFMRNLFSAVSIVVGSVFLQHKLGGGSLTQVGRAASDSEASGVDNGTYMSALRILWAFYTAVCGVMLFASMFIKGRDYLDVFGALYNHE